MLKGLGSVLGLAAQSALSLVGVRAYEQPPYRVVGRAGPAEVREYGPRLAVETTLDPGTRDQAFGLLAGYIFGKNRATGGGATKIAMTTPVEMRSERIAMTAPVEQAKSGARVTMRFFLPRSSTRETAPEPTDPRVRVVEVPGETLAVLRFSGSTDDARIAERKGALLGELRGSAWEPAGEPVFFGYDPPFTPPFLRRNEVAVPVRRR
ncbi:heme-binding protein [Craurococcus roseus]|uniref:Heme-binding protein n=1 Tax=Craurococcus roseus TaxID=77585 RepID=A0ABP3RCR6_9PROT